MVAARRTRPTEALSARCGDRVSSDEGPRLAAYARRSVPRRARRATELINTLGARRALRLLGRARPCGMPRPHPLSRERSSAHRGRPLASGVRFLRIRDARARREFPQQVRASVSGAERLSGEVGALSELHDRTPDNSDPADAIAVSRDRGDLARSPDNKDAQCSNACHCSVPPARGPHGCGSQHGESK
jgi:hypothetical protein